ncbi:MAG: bis(5'-nucleosyl)-tetraphosphatase [Nitrososphaerales archaeon]
MLEERSAGAIVIYKSDSVVEYLILHYPAGHWDFPKGNVEKGESELDAAIREITEETGLTDLKFVNGFKKTIQYYYKKGDRLVKKSVTFYLAEAKTKDVKLSFEHQGYIWLPIDEALAKVTYQNAKNVLREAQRFLAQIDQ